MRGHDEEAAILADAYIDALLARPRVVALPGPGSDQSVSRAAALMSGLPRFHPSFAFEEALAARLRHAADASSASLALGRRRLAEVIAFPRGRSGTVRSGTAPSVAVRSSAALPAIDRRLIVGGAIVGGALASGVSMAALYAWWNGARRPRSGVVA